MTQTLPSVCPLDCPDTCSLTVTVHEHQIVKVRGSQVNPLTRGAICGKVSHYPEWVHGPEAIMPLNYAGPHGFLAAGSMDLRFFHKLGASRLARRPLCGGVKSEAFLGTYGAVPLMRPEHVAAAQLVIVWGNNVTVSQMHLRPLIRAAQKQGARLVVVDPRRVPIARQADLHLALRPGTDVVLAWALAALDPGRGSGGMWRGGGADPAACRMVSGDLPGSHLPWHRTRTQSERWQWRARHLCLASPGGEIWRAGWWHPARGEFGFPQNPGAFTG